MISDTGTWEDLEIIQRGILKLEQKRRSMWRERSQNIADRASVLDYLEAGADEFAFRMRRIEAELYELWDLKRKGLTRLNGSYEWSFAGPIIDTSGA